MIITARFFLFLLTSFFTRPLLWVTEENQFKGENVVSIRGKIMVGGTQSNGS